MRDQPSPTNIDAGGPYDTVLADEEAERDRYELLLDINNAVVTQLSWGTCSSRWDELTPFRLANSQTIRAVSSTHGLHLPWKK